MILYPGNDWFIFLKLIGNFIIYHFWEHGHLSIKAVSQCLPKAAVSLDKGSPTIFGCLTKPFAPSFEIFVSSIHENRWFRGESGIIQTFSINQFSSSKPIRYLPASIPCYNVTCLLRGSYNPQRHLVSRLHTVLPGGFQNRTWLAPFSLSPSGISVYQKFNRFFGCW